MTGMEATLLSRQTTTNGNDVICYDAFGNIVTNCRSGWYDWGRWVALALVIIGFFVIFCAFSILSSRRRRRVGRQPLYGTGWVGRTPFGHGTANYNPNYHQQAPPGQYGNYGPQGQGYGYNYGPGQGQGQPQGQQGYGPPGNAGYGGYYSANAPPSYAASSDAGGPGARSSWFGGRHQGQQQQGYDGTGGQGIEMQPPQRVYGNEVGGGKK